MFGISGTQFYKMGLLGKLVLLSVTLTAVGIGYVVYNLKQVPEVPKLKSTWWGPGQPRKVDESIRSFKINVPEEVNNITFSSYDIDVFIMVTN